MVRLKFLALAASLMLLPSLATAQPMAPAPATQTAADAATNVSPAKATTLAAPSKAAAPAAEGQDFKAVATSIENSLHPQATIGQPVPRGYEIQPQVTEVGQEAKWMHDVILVPLITVISIFVLLLLVWVIFRYRASANPVPSRTSHNTLIEIIWTLAPVLILVAIAVPSIRLLAHQYDPPKADLVIKVTGHQWYWSYEYPDAGGLSFDSIISSDADAAKRGDPRLLGVDNRLVVPVGKTVKVLVTADDVIHSFAVPAFWVKMDAVPGRINETWFKIQKPGIYYGQCSELCGTKHAFMPIVVEALPPADYARWLAAKQGAAGITPTSAAAPAASDPNAAAAATPAVPAAPAAPATVSPAELAPAAAQKL
jgi:cytochrome c oxidase subunit II